MPGLEGRRRAECAVWDESRERRLNQTSPLPPGREGGGEGGRHFKRGSGRLPLFVMGKGTQCHVRRRHTHPKAHFWHIWEGLTPATHPHVRHGWQRDQKRPGFGYGRTVLVGVPLGRSMRASCQDSRSGKDLEEEQDCGCGTSSTAEALAATA